MFSSSETPFNCFYYSLSRNLLTESLIQIQLSYKKKTSHHHTTWVQFKNQKQCLSIVRELIICSETLFPAEQAGSENTVIQYLESVCTNANNYKGSISCCIRFPVIPTSLCRIICSVPTRRRPYNHSQGCAGSDRLWELQWCSETSEGRFIQTSSTVVHTVDLKRLQVFASTKSSAALI